MPRASPYRIVLTEDERRRLEAAARRYTAPCRDVVRARIVLYAAEGLSNGEIAARLDTPPQVVSKCRKRFFDRRLAGLGDLRRGGRPADFPPEVVVAVKPWPASCPRRPGRRWPAEMVFSQLAKGPVRACGGGWPDVADLALVVGDDHAVDEPLGQLAPLVEGGGGESGSDGLAERFDAIGHGLQFQALFSGGAQLALLGRQGGAAAVQFVLLALEFGQRDDLGKVSVQQPLLLAFELAQGLADRGLPGLELLGQPCSAPRPGQRAGDLGRVGQQRAQVGPDQLV